MKKNSSATKLVAKLYSNEFGYDLREETELAFDYLTESNPLGMYWSMQQYIKALGEFLLLKGEESLQKLAGFKLFCERELVGNAPEQERAIITTFAHDLGGRADEFMLPRSNSYLKYWRRVYKELMTSFDMDAYDRGEAIV